MTRYAIDGAVGRFTALGAERSVDIDDSKIRVRFGWAFHADIPRGVVASALVTKPSFLAGVGVHGLAGTWVVNGRYGDATEIAFDDSVHARVAGIPVKLKKLLVVVDDPEALAAELSTPAA